MAVSRERRKRPDEEEREESSSSSSEEVASDEPQPLDSGTVMALQEADPHTRARALLQMQRSHGNEAVQRVIRSIQGTDAGIDARVQALGEQASEPAPSGKLEKAVLYREAIAAELDAAPVSSKTERDLVQDNVNTVAQIFANYQAALHMFEAAIVGGAGEKVPRELAMEVLREVARQVVEPVLEASVGVAPGMADLVGAADGKVEDARNYEKPEPGMSAPADALRNLVIAERYRIATSHERLVRGQVTLMRLADDRAAGGNSQHGLLAAAAGRLDELQSSSHSASGIFKLLMESWDNAAKGGAAVAIELDENWNVSRAHIRMSDGRRLASQLLDDGSGTFDLNKLKLTRSVTWHAADLARCDALLDAEGRIRQLDRNEKGGQYFADFERRLRTEGLPVTHVLTGD
jgi:hypothetical protein